MKTKIATSLVLFFLVISCMNTVEKPSAILGTWKMESYKYGDNEMKASPDSIQMVKLITPTYFTWIHYKTKDKIVWNSAGGTYTFDGDNYIENIDFGGYGMSSYLGKTQTFKVKIENDKMYLSGALSDGYKIEEVWIKIK